MSALNTLTEDQLFFLVEHCSSLKKLKDSFGDDLSSNLLSEMKDCYQINLSDRNHASRSLLSGIAAASLPVDIFWSLVSWVNLGVASLWIAGLFSLLTLGVGIGYFIYSYQKHSEKSQELNEFFQLSTLKLRAADILLFSNKQILPNPGAINYFPEEKKPLSAKPSMIAGVTTGSLLFGTFFWGSIDILTTLKLAAVATALSGTIGLTIAALVAVSVGVYLGYKHYQARKQTQETNVQQENMHHQLIEKSRQCSTLFAMKKLHRHEQAPEFSLKRQFDTDHQNQEFSFFSRNHVDHDEKCNDVDDALELRQHFTML